MEWIKYFSAFGGATLCSLFVTFIFNFVVNGTKKKRAQKEELFKKQREEELNKVFIKTKTWIKEHYGDDFLVHTPTTMYNFHYPSMQKHPVCRNFVMVFGRAYPLNFEFLMGFPIGASSPNSLDKKNFELWNLQ